MNARAHSGTAPLQPSYLMLGEQGFHTIDHLQSPTVGSVTETHVHAARL